MVGVVCALAAACPPSHTAACSSPSSHCHPSARHYVVIWYPQRATCTSDWTPTFSCLTGPRRRMSSVSPAAGAAAVGVPICAALPTPRFPVPPSPRLSRLSLCGGGTELPALSMWEVDPIRGSGWSGPGSAQPGTALTCQGLARPTPLAVIGAFSPRGRIGLSEAALCSR